jgi:fructose-bisphosphate aldolase class I
MKTQLLIDTARALVADDKGILAMDESVSTCDKRFALLGIPQEAETRSAYRELLITSAGLSEAISGAILFDETLHQARADGVSLVRLLADAGILLGIKVDTGSRDLAGHPGEKITEGLDGLRERLRDYVSRGARFAKWRAVFSVGETLPSPSGLEAQAQALARYAALCQEAGLVPIVEPEILMEGTHSLERGGEVSEATLRAVFVQLSRQRVMLEGMLLKPNMVLPGVGCPATVTAEQVAEATLRVLGRSVPAAVPGIVFLSGGQSAREASERLHAINRCAGGRAPWALSFSFGRALQQPALEIWRGEESAVGAAQRALLHRARCNRAARRGHYDRAVEAGQP